MKKSSNVLFTIWRILLVAILVLAIAFFVFRKNTVSETPPSQLFEKVSAAVNSEKMALSSNRFFKKYYGLNAADFEDVLFFAPVTNMDADELLVVCLKDPNQAEAVTEAILKRQADKAKTFEGYAPEQYALAEDYLLDVQGNYILFVVDPNAQAIDAVFAEAL